LPALSTFGLYPPMVYDLTEEELESYLMELERIKAAQNG
jgi:hypothetical protein